MSTKGNGMRICVLGAGPAGLMVTHAAAMQGHDVVVYSDGEPSRLYGAQYLHQPIPGIDGTPVVTLWHTFVGTLDGYRRKVYGMEWDGEVSPEQFSGHTSAWDIRYTYDELVNRYWSGVFQAKFTGWGLIGAQNEQAPSMADMKYEFDMVFCTIPRKRICINPGHDFSQTEIWAIGDAPDLDIKNPIQVESSTLNCNGDLAVSWYRTCNVFGHSTTEWPKGKKKPPITGVTAVSKPLKTNCDCFDGDMVFLGRYGKWQKGVLTHQAFQQADYMMMLKARG
jgi:hypothetical protein